jgi:hypothetical protein
MQPKLAIQPRLAWNSRASCLSLPSAGITGMCHHTQLRLISNWRKYRLLRLVKRWKVEVLLLLIVLFYPKMGVEPRASCLLDNCTLPPSPLPRSRGLGHLTSRVFFICLQTAICSSIPQNFQTLGISLSLFWGTGVWTQGLYLEPLHQPYCFCEGVFLR